MKSFRKDSFEAGPRGVSPNSHSVAWPSRQMSLFPGQSLSVVSSKTEAPSMKPAAPNPCCAQLLSAFLSLQSTKKTMHTRSDTQSQGTQAPPGHRLQTFMTQGHYLLLRKDGRLQKICLCGIFSLY